MSNSSKKPQLAFTFNKDANEMNLFFENSDELEKKLSDAEFDDDDDACAAGDCGHDHSADDYDLKDLDAEEDNYEQILDLVYNFILDLADEKVPVGVIDVVLYTLWAQNLNIMHESESFDSEELFKTSETVLPQLVHTVTEVLKNCELNGDVHITDDFLLLYKLMEFLQTMKQPKTIPTAEMFAEKYDHILSERTNSLFTEFEEMDADPLAVERVLILFWTLIRITTSDNSTEDFVKMKNNWQDLEFALLVKVRECFGIDVDLSDEDDEIEYLG